MPDEMGFRTTSIRLPDTTFEALHVIAKVRGVSVAELLRQAVDAVIESAKSDTRLADAAARMKAEIEAEAASRVASLDTLIAKPNGEAKKSARSQRNGGNGGKA